MPRTQRAQWAACRQRWKQHTHHMPRAAPAANASPATCRKSQQTIGDVKVRSHTFRFIWPEQTDALKIPNACNVCHDGQDD